MKFIRIILKLFLSLIILLLIAGTIWLRHVSRKALPDYNTDVMLNGLREPVEVLRDTFGIPHVYAENDQDLYRVCGYLMAQDRLWQMDLLRTQEVHSTLDMERMQADQNSSWKASIMKIIQAELDQAILEGKAAELYEIFKDWNGQMDKDKIEPTLFESFYLQLMKSIFMDELGEDLYNEFLAHILLPSYLMDRCMDGQEISWCDDISTVPIENFSDLVVPSWNASVAWLSDNYGKDSYEWKWGNVHQISFTHALGSVNLLKKLFRLEQGPFEVGGGSHTVSPYSYDLTQPFTANHGSAIRLIYSTTNWDNSQVVTPTGVSGIPASDFYCNQTQMYINNNYVADIFSREGVVANAVYRCNFISNQ